MEEYDNEFNIHYSSDEEDNFNPNDIVADDILDKKQNTEGDEEENHNDDYHDDDYQNDHFEDDEFQDDDQEDDQEEQEDQEKEEILPKTVFFKQKK